MLIKILTTIELLAVLPLFASAPALAEGVQHTEPVELRNTRLASDTFVQPSLKRPLEPGERVDVPDFGEPGKWYVQRLTERTYWMICNAFATTAFVGDQGVLLIDASSSVVPADLLGAVAEFTDLPITALAYSHQHFDHNGGAGRLKAALQTEGIELRIIGSEALVRENKRYQNAIEMPTETVPNGRATFEFQKWSFKLVTPELWAHSGADSYVLTPDGVIHYVDFNYPGRVPLAYISSSQNITGWIDFLRHVLGEEWRFANLGHATVGYKADIERTFEYLDDLYSAYATEVAPRWATGEAIAAMGPQDTAGVFWGNYVDASSEAMAQKIYDKWQHMPHSEVMRSHAYKVFEESFLSYNFVENPDVRPNFSPIAPPD